MQLYVGLAGRLDRPGLSNSDVGIWEATVGCVKGRLQTHPGIQRSINENLNQKEHQRDDTYQSENAHFTHICNSVWASFEIISTSIL